MQSTPITFFSEGSRVCGSWHTPDHVSGRLRAIVQGPGWLGLHDSKLYGRYHQAMVDAGFGVLAFDYRGFGESQGNKGILSPICQLQDLINAVTYLTTREDVDADAIGAFGTGGTGGGNAILLADADPRVRAVVSQLPVADGEDWLRRMRPEHEWLAFREAADKSRRERVLTGEGPSLDPKEQIMVPTPERRATTVKADVDARIPNAVSSAAVDEIMAYKPIAAAARLRTPLLVIAVENDATTPTDHAVQLYEAARGPKELVMQRHTSHYAAYDRYWTVVTPRVVAWFEKYVGNGGVVVRTSEKDRESVTWLEASQ
jgi:uncharacterized protein